MGECASCGTDGLLAATQRALAAGAQCVTGPRWGYGTDCDEEQWYDIYGVISPAADGKEVGFSDPGTLMTAIELAAWDDERLELLGVVFNQDTPNIDQVLLGRLTSRGNTTGATIRGSVQSTVSSEAVPTIKATSLDCDKYRKCGIDSLNPGCIPVFSANQPLYLPFAILDNTAAGDAIRASVPPPITLVTDPIFFHATIGVKPIDPDKYKECREKMKACGMLAGSGR